MRLRTAVPGLLALAAFALGTPPAAALPDLLRVSPRDQVVELNRRLGGQVLDLTANHGADRRLFSKALNAPRDLYVYLPPGYDGRTPFPVMLFLHGLGQDEQIFLDIIPHFDEAIRKGRAAPMVIAMPDGTVTGRPSLTTAGSFYINSKAGRFGDYLIDDVWGFVKTQFAVRPEREAHILAGASMGGFGAFNVGFKHREEFGNLVGILPPLNLRYGDAKGRYLRDYDPKNVKLREIESRDEVVGVFYGVLPIRSRRMLDPILGTRWNDATTFVSRENPFEMLTRLKIQPGEFQLFIGYGKRDEFNIDAEVEHFLDELARKDLRATVLVMPDGRHDVATALAMLPWMNRWAMDRVAAYVPAGYMATGPVEPAQKRAGPLAPRVRLPGLLPGARPSLTER